jgi:hypothetical protein
MAVPLELMPDVLPQFFSAVPHPYSGYFLVFAEAGQSLSSRQVVYADWQGNTSLGSQVILNTAGYPSDGVNPVSIFFQPLGYKMALCPPLPLDPTNPDTANAVRTIDGVENVGQTYVGSLGTLLSTGQKSAPDGYLVTASDILVTFLGSATGVVNLPDVTTRSQPVILENIGSLSMVITANGSQTFNGTANTTFTIAAGTTPKWPSVVLLPYAATSTWYVVAGLYTT